MTVLKKKFWLVIALMIACSIALGAEKYFTVTSAMRLSGDAFVQCLTRFAPSVDNRGMLEPQKFFVTSPMELYAFINSVDEQFALDKFFGNWNGLSDLEKILWLGEHIDVESFAHGVYVFSIRIAADEPHDYNYVAENLPRLLDSYVEFAQRECTKVGVGALVPIERAQLIPASQNITRRSIVFKYMTIGAVLGAIAGLIVIFGLSMRKPDNA